MKNETHLWKISIPINPEAEEIVGPTIEAELGQLPHFYLNLETRQTQAITYVTTPARPTRGAIDRLRSKLHGLDEFTGKTLEGEIKVERLKKEDWANSWKKHFKPLSIGKNLLVKPSWSRRNARPGQKIVVLDPGLSFGTGQHATTRFCLEQLARLRKSKVQQSFLDIGTGSGILAISAVKLGYCPVEGIDFDPEAVRIASANAKRNRVLARFTPKQQDLTKAPLRPVRSYDIVCANLIYDLLLAQTRRLASRVAPGGWLVLSGILQTQFEAVAATYQGIGFILAHSHVEKEWQSGLFHDLRTSSR